jgi:hydroxyacylglutathione hydrolase
MIRRFSSIPWKSVGGCADVFIHPYLNDNYCHIFLDRRSGIAGCVDPGDSSTSLLESLSQLQKSQTKFDFKYILVTHKHSDHIDGILQLKETFPAVTVIGTGYEDIPGATRRVFDGDCVNIGDLQVQIIFTPCHTSGHVCFYVKGPEMGSSPILFSGDTLFLGGCGRFFEGTASQMLANMDKFLELDPSTQVYCGHEYTISNINFLRSLYSNSPILAKITEKYNLKYNSLKLKSLPTLPSTIREEREYNPFMQCREKILQDLVASPNDPVETMKIIRELKNQF